ETSVTLNENSVIADTVTTVAYVSTVTTVHTDKTAAPVSVKENAKTTAAATTQKPTTTKAPSTEVIPEKSNGISLMTKTTPVVIGNSAVIMVQGTAGKKYTIDFYKSADKTADYDGLETKTADSNGFVTWTFVIDDSCDRGNRKIVIKEKNSSNYLQTSIAVQ
ncbi:MAG: hypothetical protein IJ264_00365, partial [Clostridia bacterium]|nr:hypothetical protein [Clostridia bacterium]